MRPIVGVFAAATLLYLLLLDARPAAAENVTLPDCNPGTLISAITTANTNAEHDTINLNGCTVELIASVDGSNGLPILLADGGNTLTMQNGTIQRSNAGGTPNFRIVEVESGARVTLLSLTIRNGFLQVSIGYGGGVFNNGGTLTVENSTIAGNTNESGNAFGGGLANLNGTLNVVGSTVANNASQGSPAFGGGIYSSGTATLNVTNSTIVGNSATGPSFGGGILHSGGTATIVHSTITGNSVNSIPLGGAGLHNSATMSVRASIVAFQQAGDDCNGGIPSLGSNIESGTTCGFTGTGDLQSVTTGQLQLGALANNGGPGTQTQALQFGSVAIDAVQGSCTSDGTGGGTTILLDQRTLLRPIDGDGNTTSVCDIGAFERAPGTLQFSSPTYSTGEVGGTVNITVNRIGGADGAVGATITLSGGSATAGADYTGTTFPVSFANGETSKSVPIPIVNDALDEPDEAVGVALSAPTGGAVLGSPIAAGLTILDNDDPPTVSIGNVQVSEGNAGSVSAQLQVTLSAASGRTVTVQAQTANGAGVGGAVAGTDYTTTNQSVTFTPGETVKVVSVPVLGDTLDETDETFTVSLPSADNATIATATGTVTIVDDDTSLLTIDDQSLVEGNAGSTNATFTITLSLPNSRTVTVQAQTANQTASAGTDYTTGSQTVTFNPGETSKPFVAAVLGDTADEPNEAFVVNLTAPTNATLSDAQGVGTILDDDGLPTLSIVDRAVVEGNSGTANAIFSVALLPASGQEVRVTVQTANGTALAGVDYQATGPTTLIFAPGEAGKTFTVPVVGERLAETDETFVVNLTNPVNATIQDGQAVGTIQNDDVTAVSIGDVSVTEGNAGTTNATFTISLDLTSSQTVTVVAQTANGTATAGADYTAVGLVTVTFTPGVTSQTVVVPIVGDTLDELDETFFVNVSAPTNAVPGDPQGVGTIRDDDGPPSLAVNDATVVEAAGVATGAIFTIALVPASSQTVTVVVQSANGSATAGADYTAVGPVTLTFAPGETSKTVVVPILDDAVVEGDETFALNLSNQVNATLADAQGLGTIQNDDAAPPVVPPVPAPPPVASPAPVVATPVAVAPPAAEPYVVPPDDDTDKPQKETQEQRQQRERSNQSGKDDVYVEGNVVEVHADVAPAYVVIVNRDGPVKVILYGDAAPAARSIQVGDYLEADGEKIHEGLFEASEVSTSRGR